ncbi:unnamed protein product [Brassica rapa]|nr:unnamed protein product [Brassica napus]CAG7902469.1 unnamed protein product [Brassica rapa]CDY70800.1 BnaAnng35080D [Brassica napus]VDC98654.1 unnamed protein product [Brassica rapa]
MYLALPNKVWLRKLGGATPAEEEIREGVLASSTSKPVLEVGNALYITSRTAVVDQSKLIVFLM